MKKRRRINTCDILTKLTKVNDELKFRSLDIYDSTEDRADYIKVGPIKAVRIG